MRTGRTLTVPPPRKIGDPPKKLETPQKNLRPPPGTDLQGMLGYPPPPREQNHTRL